MDDEYDIYGDLDGLQAETQKENKVIQELHTQIEELKAKIAEKEREKQEIANKNAVLLENISSLLLTAKAELKRKDALIAEVRREKDNVTFRRRAGSIHIRKIDQGTQTTLIQFMDQQIQTEHREVNRKNELSGRKNGRRERSRSLERDRVGKHKLHSRDRERIRGTSMERRRSCVRTRPIERRVAVYEERRRIQKQREASRERQRERERRARRENRTPEIDTKRSDVRFNSPIRVKSEVVCEISSTFIPMNRKDLDRYVKEIGRSENSSPVLCIHKSNTVKRDAMKLPKVDQRSMDTETDSRKRPRTLEKRSHKHPEKVPKIEKQRDLIQSDEIGTTAPAANSTMLMNEDIEQKMTVLHGESTPKTPNESALAQTSIELLLDLNSGDSPKHLCVFPPPTLVIPPPEPPIIEQVPEIPNDDEPKLNDSRELRIIESDELLMLEQEHENERSSSAETVIQNSVTPHKEELEDGELPSSDDEECNLRKERVSKTARNKPRNDSKMEVTSSHSLRSYAQFKNAEVSKKDELPKTAGQNEIIIRQKEKPLSPVLRSTCLRSSKENETKHKRNLVSAFKASFSTKHAHNDSNKLRRRTVTEPSPVKMILVQSRHSEPPRLTSHKKSHHHKKSKTLKELFGTDESENSVCGSPIVTRKRNLDRKERDRHDSKKRRKSPTIRINGHDLEIQEKLQSKPTVDQFKTPAEPANCKLKRHKKLHTPPPVNDHAVAPKVESPRTVEFERVDVKMEKGKSVTPAPVILDQETAKEVVESIKSTIKPVPSIEPEICANAVMQDDSEKQFQSPSPVIASKKVLHEPVTVQEEAAVVKEDLSAAQRDPAAVHETPTAVHETPAAVQEEPVVVQEKPAAVQEELAVVQEELVAVQDEPAAVLEEPAVVQEELAAAQEELVAVQDEPAAVQEEPANEEDVVKQTDRSTEPLTYKDDSLNTSLTRLCTDSPLKLLQPFSEKSFICSSRYSEYRIEFDNEVETTVYLTRKKKKKKGKPLSLNASGTNV
ncbi:caldesmon [Topomyia yanbarensis]|uniref:caldesmon n=1 Tax=Topomyia yanbarensis TaxID=2498891 RepID=UPI00273BEA7A|nr:caldesmon [Topomyia yanbarensis]